MFLTWRNEVSHSQSVNRGTGLLAMYCHSRPNTCSMRLSSLEHTGQYMGCIFSVLFMFSTNRTISCRTLSFTKTRNQQGHQSNIWDLNILSVYICVIKVPTDSANVHASVYIHFNLYHQTTLSVLWSFLYECRIISITTPSIPEYIGLSCFKMNWESSENGNLLQWHCIPYQCSTSMNYTVSWGKNITAIGIRSKRHLVEDYLAIYGFTSSYFQ